MRKTLSLSADAKVRLAAAKAQEVAAPERPAKPLPAHAAVFSEQAPERSAKSLRSLRELAEGSDHQRDIDAAHEAFLKRRKVPRKRPEGAPRTQVN